MMNVNIKFTAQLAILVMTTLCWAVSGHTAELTKIEAYPANIDLSSSRDHQTIIVQAVYADGITRDVTSEATLAVADTNLITLKGTTLFPAADGETNVTVTCVYQDY